MQNSAPSSPSSLALLTGIIDRPRATLSAVLAQPRWKWLIPAVICLAATALLLLVSAEGLSEQAAQQQATAMQALEDQMQGMTEAQRAQIRQQMATFTGPLALGLIGFATNAIGLLIGWLLGAGILFLGLSIGGADVSYAPLVAAFSWTWLPFALRDLVNAGWTLATGVVRVNPGLSYFVSSGDSVADAGNPLWLLAGQVDLFWLWHLALVYALVKAARPRGGALGLTLVYLLVYLAIRLLPALLATRLSGGL
ncbi:MAG TPA: YIP1 family protein [Anaerolineae bacterium]|nr:YIP1 family protein [Anaerolineae bacterium]